MVSACAMLFPPRAISITATISLHAVILALLSFSEGHGDRKSLGCARSPSQGAAQSHLQRRCLLLLSALASRRATQSVRPSFGHGAATLDMPLSSWSIAAGPSPSV